MHYITYLLFFSVQVDTENIRIYVIPTSSSSDEDIYSAPATTQRAQVANVTATSVTAGPSQVTTQGAQAAPTHHVQGVTAAAGVTPARNATRRRRRRAARTRRAAMLQQQALALGTANGDDRLLDQARRLGAAYLGATIRDEVRSLEADELDADDTV